MFCNKTCYSYINPVVLGERVARGRGNAQVYPYVGQQEERTHENMERWAVEASELRSSKHGVKGSTVLSHIAHFDLVNGFVPDFLHCSLLGVVRQMLSLWFDSSNHENEWYIGQPAKQRTYDQMVNGIKPPKEIRRMPRSINAVSIGKVMSIKPLYFITR